MYWKERSCEQELGNKFFLHFSQRNDSPELCEAITCKYHKSSKNTYDLPSHCLVKEKI